MSMFRSLEALAVAVGIVAAPAAVGPAWPAAGHDTGPKLTASASAIGVSTPLGMTDLIDVSKDGRIVLGLRNGRYVVRDIVKAKTLRKLPSSSDYAYYGISDNGRYAVYTRTRANATSCFEPWVRDLKTNKTRRAATATNGKSLTPAWRPTATDCPEEMDWRDQVTYSEPALSGDGRVVAFCANLKVADRLDLYVKDLKSKKMRMWPAACSEETDANGRPVRPQPPQISETGRVVLLPGFHSTGGGEAYSAAAGYHVWRPASILLNRSVIRTDVGGAWPVLTADGSAVYSIGPSTCDGGSVPCQGGSVRYDIASGATEALPAGDPGPGPMSRRGRYVLVITAAPRPGEPSGPTSCDWVWGIPRPAGSLPGWFPCASSPYGLRVLDRTTGLSTDLVPMVGVGISEVGLSPERGTSEPPLGQYRVPGRPDRTRLSGSGKVVFVMRDTINVPQVPDAGTWYALRWM